MRLVRIEDESGALALDLHPLLTVVSGLPAHLRERLVHAATALPRAQDPGVRGTVEVHGVRMDLSRETLGLLELDEDLDLVLKPSDLPHVQPVGPAVRPERQAPADNGSTGGEDLELTQARGQLAVAEAAHEAAARAIDELEGLLEAVAAERRELSAQLEASRSELDGFAVAGLKVAREEVAELLGRDTEEGGERDERAELEQRIGELIDESSRLKKELKRLRSLDPMSVRQAFMALEMSSGDKTVPSPEAESIIAEWATVSERLAVLQAGHPGSRARVAELTARRDRAVAELEAAERALRVPTLDPAKVEELERTHDEVFEAESRSNRIGGAKAKKRRDELKAREEELLAELGFETWTAYVMGISSPAADAERQHRFEVARAAVQFADDELQRVTAIPAFEDPELLEFEERQRLLLARAAHLLGADPGPDPVPALRQLRIPSSAVGGGMRAEDAAAALRFSLQGMGVELPAEELSTEQLHDLAAGWLEEMGELPSQIAAVEAERAAVEERIARLAERLETLGEGLTADGESPDLAAAQARLEEAQERVNRHEESLARLAELQARDKVLLAEEQDLRASEGERARAAAEARDARHAARSRVRRAEVTARTRARQSTARPLVGAGVSSGGSGGSAAVDAVDSLEWYVVARLAQQRSTSFVGSLPLVVDDAFVGWPVAELTGVLERLERMSDVIQVVFISDEPEIAEWARALGEERARVVELQPSI